MGDRIGMYVRDANGEESDIIIHSHWMGRDLIKLGQIYLKERGHIIENKSCERITYDFIWWIGLRQMDTDIDLQTYDDDCEDNGVFCMNIEEMVIS